MGAAGGDDQLFKPNGVENADLAPTRAFAKYQGSGDFLEVDTLTCPYPTFQPEKLSTQVKCWLFDIRTRFHQEKNC